MAGPVIPDRYREAIGDDDPYLAMFEAPQKLRKLLKGLTEKQLSRRPAPGKWSIKEIVAHLADGEVILGSTVQLSYVDQERSELLGDRSLLDEVGGGADEVVLGKQRVPIRQYLSRFGFKGADQQKTAGELSGGERNRCHLAKLLKEGGNVILLDEPTNDLDVNTLRLLEEAILNFRGCVLVTSHDRFFLDRICTNLLVFEGDGQVRWFSGNYREYEDWRVKEFGTKLFENRRSRYRKLVKH